MGSAKLETVDSCRKDRLCQVYHAEFYHAVHVIWVTWHVHCHVSRYTGRRDGLEPSEHKKLDILTKMFKPRRAL